MAKSYDENKKCFYENDKCVSKYIYCEGYTGNDRTICESIIPYDKSNGKSLEDNYKCIMETDGCKMTEIPCKDAKTSAECSFRNEHLLDNNKKCVYINDECLEQWKDCSTYDNNAETIEKSICESIKLNNDLKKCVFTEGTMEIKNKCELKDKAL